MSRAAGLLGRAALALGLLWGPGCVTLVQSTRGNPIDPRAVAALERGRTSLPQLLTLLGAPQEVHLHADGQLLVYVFRARNTFRLGISASQALRFIDASQLVSEALGNLSLTIERAHADEDRLVLLLDHEGTLQAIGARRGTDALPLF